MKSSENLINSSIKEFSSHDMEELFVGSEVELRGTPTIGIASFVATVPTGYIQLQQLLNVEKIIKISLINSYVLIKVITFIKSIAIIV
jgi:hypothetical protein